MSSPARARLPRTVKALAAVSFFTDASSEMIYPLLPAFLTATLGASAAWVGIIEGAADATASLLKLASGWWSDRVRRRKPLIVAGYTIAAVLRPLVAVAGATWQVLAIRVGDRAGKGIRGAPRDAMIADSVGPNERGRAFGTQRAADHAGAFVGPLIAFVLLQWVGVSVRTVFLLAAIPGAIAIVVAVFGVREADGRGWMVDGREKTEDVGLAASGAGGSASSSPSLPAAAPTPLGGSFWRYLAVLVLFTLGNSTDAFLLLKASELGVTAALLPILWAALHVVKSATSIPAGAWSDRVGRRTMIAAGWLWYALVYLGFAFATDTWHAWALFIAYGLFFGLTEGVERALVADLVPAARRGLAFGWYNGVIGAAVLPASVAFGLMWDWKGSGFAFMVGAASACLAAVGLVLVRPAQQQRLPGRE
ncbi:MAG: MFS transporter [Gemmatimonadaceae bacterium]|nr:MFS transporter [Gemmatimonadaceae bacterium]